MRRYSAARRHPHQLLAPGGAQLAARSHFQLLAVVSLPQFAFQHYDAGVKASIVFLRRLEDGKTVPDDTPIFMALADNIGYDATGRKTFVVTVEEEDPGREED